MPELATITRPAAGRAVGVLAALLDRLPPTRPTLAVLTYHRVAPADSRPELHASLRVELAAFVEQVQLLIDHAHLVDLDDLLAAAEGRAELPPRAVHLTFDDGYAEFEEHAWPVLHRLGVPATMFVPTSFPDHDRSFWWDRLSAAVHGCPARSITVGHRSWSTASDLERSATFRALRSEVAARPHDAAMELVDCVVEAAEAAGAPRLAPATSSWEGLRSMAAEGLRLGAHTRVHPFLDRVDGSRIEEEIAGSLADVRREAPFGARTALAYPSGAYNDRVVDSAARHVPLAFTTERGVVDLTAPDWLRVPRINVGPHTSAPLVRLQLTPGPHTVRSMVRSVLHRTATDRSNTSEGIPWS